MTALEKYITTFLGIQPEYLAVVSECFKPTTLKKGDYFVKSGALCNRMGFVQTGLLREFVLTENKEVTKWIITPGYFVVDLAGFLFQQPARWNIQALSDVELFVIDIKTYQSMDKVVPQWPTLEKLFLAKCFTMLENRIVQHLSLSAEERYQQLYQFNKELFNQVSLQYLASMLGITPETLSRLRRKHANMDSRE